MALSILGINTALGEDAAAGWDHVGYKGGSEPGVLSMSWLLRDHGGAWYVLTLGWTAPDAASAPPRLPGLARRARRRRCVGYAFQPWIPHLTRSSLRRCLQRHGIGRLPAPEGEAAGRKRFRAYRIRLFAHRHRPGAGRRGASSPVRRDRAHQQVRLRASGGGAAAATASALVKALVRSCPATSTRSSSITASSSAMRRATVMLRPHATSVHMSDRIRRQHGIEPAHQAEPSGDQRPETSGQVERINRTIKDANVKRYHHGSHDDRRHLQLFLDACNHGRPSRRSVASPEHVARIWTEAQANPKATRIASPQGSTAS